MKLSVWEAVKIDFCPSFNLCNIVISTSCQLNPQTYIRSDTAIYKLRKVGQSSKIKFCDILGKATTFLLNLGKMNTKIYNEPKIYKRTNKHIKAVKFSKE